MFILCLNRLFHSIGEMYSLSRVLMGFEKIDEPIVDTIHSAGCLLLSSTKKALDNKKMNENFQDRSTAKSNVAGCFRVFDQINLTANDRQIRSMIIEELKVEEVIQEQYGYV